MKMIKYNYDDIVIVPDIVTDIRSRSQCNWKTDEGLSPIWASPMDTVISTDNWKVFCDADVNVIMPRNIPLSKRMEYLVDFAKSKRCNVPYVAFSLKEASDLFTKGEYSRKETVDRQDLTFRICIDAANGHMIDQINLIKKIKDNLGNRVKIMGGNVANPKTYELYDKAGCDYLRCSIGSGSACLTSSNPGIHFPIFSLLKETYEIKKKIGGKCKIVADGGIRGFRDVQKALIYADYVMIGGLFNKAIESAGKTTYGNFYWNVRGNKIFRPLKTLFYYGKEVSPDKYDKIIQLIKDGKLVVWKEFYGMSTKRAQKDILEGNGKSVDVSKLKTSEGVVTKQMVEYSVSGWMKNEIDYLKSAMSYTNSHDLKEYKNSEWVPINDIKYNK